MTTIAYKNGIVVADTGAVLYGDTISSSEEEKIMVLSNGSVFVSTGDQVNALRMKDHLERQIKLGSDIHDLSGGDYLIEPLEFDGAIKAGECHD